MTVLEYILTSRVKRTFDVLVSSALLILLSPLFALIAVLIRCSSGSPVIFRQQRPGLHGETFVMYKFRTMRPPLTGENPWITDELRTTGIGRVLRSTSLDELPQLLNVVSGRMSLVGPRPLLAEYLDKYSSHHARRHDVRPGITGLAQVSGRKFLAYSEKLDLDVRYIDEWSFGLDLRILLKTLTNSFDHATNSGRSFEEFDDLGLTSEIRKCGSGR
jgi:lipopolysaccharide/colanic/teichoic acid biosynthesis glycosyltransferase